MREIKFRFWNSRDGVMSYDMFVWWENPDANEIFDVPGIIPMQFTGLKDKNGKEIYEGDFLDWHWVERYEVSFRNGKFIAKFERNNHEFIDELIDACGSTSVVGNVYENPELTK